MKLDFSVGMGRNLRMDEIADHARVAEECGFSHMTFVDQPNMSRDVYAMMTIAALNTHRIHIGQGVTDPYTYRPWVTANATASINELSGGRAFVGIGAGGAWGKAMKPRPMKEIREAISFIRDYTAGKAAEFQGTRMQSEWIRRQVPVYMAADGPRATELAGEVADGVIFGSIHPEKVKWHMELIERGAQKVGRDPSEIDTWARTLIYIADSKEQARREVASYAATWAYSNYFGIFQWENPDVVDLRKRFDRTEPGLVDELKRVHDAFDPAEHELTDASHALLISQQTIDAFMLTGRPEEIRERIEELGELGVKNISTVLFTVFDKKGMMREISNKIMPYFRN